MLSSDILLQPHVISSNGLDDVEALVNAAFVSPSMATEVGGILPALAALPDRNAALAALRILVAPLPADDREAMQPALTSAFRWADGDAARFLADCPPPPGSPTFKPLGLAELMRRPSKQWMIDQVIGRGDLGLIYGAPGTGKTFAVIDLIFSACLGEQWAMRFDIPDPLTVAYCAGEGLGGLADRFEAAAVRYGVEGDLPGFHLFELAPQLYQDNGEGIGAFIADWKASGAPALDLLVVDTLHSATAGADENSAQHMGVVMTAAKLAIRELGCAVILVHHTNKAGTGERGSSALRGAMDSMISTSECGAKYMLKCEKLKDGAAWKQQTFDLVAAGDRDSVRVWWDEPNDDSGASNAGQKTTDKKSLYDTMYSYPDTWFTVKRLAEAIDQRENYTRKLLAELLDEGQCNRKLANESKDQSSRNPWVYSVSAVQENG